MKNCSWEEIRGFASPGEYRRFIDYIEGLVSTGHVQEVPVDPTYGSNQVYGGRWFADKSTGEIWRLVEPDFPLKGLWEPIAHNYGVVVSRNSDGSHTWSGRYNGAEIKQAVPICDGERCILLLDPDASQHSAFENLLCIDRKGSPIWTAGLPANPDVFLEIAPASEGIWANTWSGLKILLDKHTGAELKRIFVK